MVEIYPYEEEKKFKLLIQCLKKYKENCVFWIGAGISKIAGYPLWKELVLEVINFFEKNEDKLSFEKKIEFESLKDTTKQEEFSEEQSSEELIGILQELKYLNEDLYIEGIKQAFKDREKKQNSKIYLKLGKFVTRGIPIATTNIDKGLEIALKIPKSKISIVSLGNYNLDSMIFYLHGRLDKPKSWILSEGEYGEKYGNSPEFLDFWKKFLNKYKVIIFLGYSLKEEDIRRKFYNGDNVLFWIERISKEDNRQKKIEDMANVIKQLKRNKIIIYPIIYKYDNENSVFKLLDKIYQKAFGLTLQDWEEQSEQD